MKNQILNARTILLLLVLLLTTGVFIVSMEPTKASDYPPSTESTVRSLPQTLLIFSHANEVWAIDLATNNTFVLGEWAGFYNYEIEFATLQNLYGGKISFSSLDGVDNSLLGDLYRTIQNPFEPERAISTYMSAVNDTSWLLITRNDREETRINISELGGQFPLLPIGWLSSKDVLIAEFTPSGSHCTAYYILDIVSRTLTEIPLVEVVGHHLTTMVGSYPNTLLAVNADNNLTEIDLGTFTTLRQWDVELDYLWGWLNSVDIALFQQELAEFNRRRLSQPNTDPFLYWPVPSNHTIACGIACYPGHVGTDIGTSTSNNTPIYATSYGIVTTIVNDQPYGYNRVISPSRGNYVHIQHDNDYYTAYYHMTSNIQVVPGQRVVPGTLLGYGSNSGYTCGTQPANSGCMGYLGSYYHLHFEVQGNCGSAACWIDPFAENLWILNSNGSVKDPPPPDTIAPTVSISSGPNTWVTQTSAIFSWTGSDNQTPTNNLLYRYRLAGITDWTEWVTNTTHTFTNLANGWYSFEVQARDLAWYESSVVVRNFGVDTENPSNPTSVNPGCTATNDDWQNTCTDPAFTWSGAGDGNGSGVKDYHVYWGTNPSGTPDTWRSTSDFDPPAISAPGGVATYYLRVATRDNVGHEAIPTTLFSLRYDNSNPVGNPLINGGASTVNNVTVQIQHQGTDTGSGIAYVLLTNDGTSWQSTPSNSIIPWSILGINRQWNPVWVQLEDGAGNRSPVYALQACLDLYPASPSSNGYRLWSAGSTSAGGQASSSSFLLAQTVGQTPSGLVLSSSSYR